MRRAPLIALLAGVVALAALLAPGPAAAQFSVLGLKNSLVQFALRQISVEGEFEIKAEGVEESKDGAFSLVGLTIADGQGVWFKAKSASVIWNATRILRGELDIQDLALTDMEILRAPTPPEVEVKDDSELGQATFDPFAWPRSPINTYVRSLRVVNAYVAPGVIDAQSLRFEATGAFRDAGEIQSLKLDLDRTDDIEGVIKLDYVRDFSDESLRLALDAKEDAGGLVASMAGLPEDSASSVKIDASGPLVDWKLSLAAQTQDMLDVTGNAVIDASAPISIQAGLSIVPGEKMSPQMKAALGREAKLDIAVHEDDEGRIVIQRGDFLSPSLGLDATGTFVRDTGAMDFDLKLAAEKAMSEVVEGVDFERVGFDGSLKGTTEDFTAKGTLSLADLKTAPADVASAELAVTASLDGEQARLETTGGARGVRLDKIGPDVLGETKLTLRAGYDLAAKTATLEVLDVTAPLLSVKAEGKADVGGESADLTYAISTPDLAPVAAAYDVAAAGALQAEGRAEGPFSDLHVSGRAAAEGLVFDGESWGRVEITHDITVGETIAGRADVSAAGSPAGPASVAAEFALEGETLTLKTLKAEALKTVIEGEAQVDLAKTLTEGELRVTASDLSAASDLLGQPVGGRLEARLTLTAPDGRQDAHLKGEAQGLEGFGASAGDMKLDVTVRDALGAPDAVFALAAKALAAEGVELASAEITGEASDLTGAPSAQGKVVAQGIAMPEAGLSVASATIEGEGRDLIAAPSVRGSAQVGRIDMTSAGVSLASVNAEADLTDLTGEANGWLTVSTGRLDAGGATLSGIQARVEGANLIADPRGKATATVSGVEVDGVASLPKVSLNVEGGMSDARISLDSDGESADGEALSIRIAAQGGMSQDGAAKLTFSRIDLSKGQADEPERIEVVQQGPLTVTAQGGTTRIQGLNLTLPGGGLRGDVALAGGGMHGKADLDLPDLGAIGAAFDAPVQSGRLSLAAVFDTRAGSPSANIDLKVSELVAEEIPDEAGAIAIDAQATWNGRMASMDASLRANTQDPLILRASLPLRPAGLIPAPPPGAQLDAGVVWNGRAETIWPLLPLPDHVLSGDLDVDLKVQGTLQNLRPAGSISLTNGSYQNLELGTVLTNLEVTSRLRDGGGLVVELSATDGAKGPINAEIQLKGQGGLEAVLTAKNAVLVRREDVTAAISADIRAEGKLPSPAVTGEIRIDRAEVRLVNTTPPTLPSLGEVEIKGAPPKEEEPEPEGGPTLDLTIVAPGGIYVRGRGLDSEWEAHLEVKGDAASPRLTGLVQKRRGTLSFIGREFTLTTGTVRFTGGKDIDPVLNVVLQHERDEITGRIVVSGTASNPKLSLESTPILPESEVLPRTIFGQPSQSLTGAQAIQLASGLATLASGDEGVLDSVRSTVGLDVLSVDSDGDETAVKAGQNLAEGVFVGVSQPLDGGPPALEVEVDVFRNVTVDAQTSAGQDGSSLGVKWKYDW